VAVVDYRDRRLAAIPESPDVDASGIGRDAVINEICYGGLERIANISASRNERWRKRKGIRHGR